MASQKKIIQNAAGQLNFSFCKKKAAAYGYYEGYVVVLYPDNTSRKQNITVSVCGCKENRGIQASELIFQGMPDKVNLTAEKFKLSATVPVKGSASNISQNLAAVIFSAVGALKRGEYTSCDEFGVEGLPEVYLYQGERYVFLCGESADKVQRAMESGAAARRQIRENYALGIVGALVGALIGMLLILLVARMGFVSVLAGAAMGILIVYLYEKFGRKYSMVGFIITTVISAIMSYLAFRLDSAFSLQKAVAGSGLGLTFGDCFFHAKEIFQAVGGMSTYYGNLFLIMASGIGGAVAVGWGNYSKDAQQFNCVLLKNL